MDAGRNEAKRMSGWDILFVALTLIASYVSYNLGFHAGTNNAIKEFVGRFASIKTSLPPLTEASIVRESPCIVGDKQLASDHDEMCLCLDCMPIDGVTEVQERPSSFPANQEQSNQHNNTAEQVELPRNASHHDNQ